MGEAHFDGALDQEIGTFFLTDYIVRHFERIVIVDLGIRDHPHLRDIYFVFYRRVLYVAQTDDAALVEKARRVAARLQLDYDFHYTRYGDYTAFLQNLYRRCHPSVAASKMHGYRGGLN